MTIRRLPITRVLQEKTMKKSLLPTVIFTGFLAFAIMAAAGPPDSPEKLSADSTMKDPYNRYDVSHLMDLSLIHI